MSLDFCGREDKTGCCFLVRYTSIAVWLFYPFPMHLAFEFMVKPLSALSDHTPAWVVEIQPGALAPRLVEMGLCKGTGVKVLFRAPFNGPIAVDLGSSVLSLRVDEARLVMIDDEWKEGA
jgi:Fe2+ transport system protein FeoA